MSSHRIDFPRKGGAPRHWTAPMKEEIVLATLEPGATVSSVARIYDLDPSQVYQWRKALNVSRLPSNADMAASTEFLPVHVLATDACAPRMVGQLQEVASATERPAASRASSSRAGMIEIQVGSLHRVRVCDDFVSDTLERVLDIIRRQR